MCPHEAKTSARNTQRLLVSCFAGGEQGTRAFGGVTCFRRSKARSIRVCSSLLMGKRRRKVQNEEGGLTCQKKSPERHSLAVPLSSLTNMHPSPDREGGRF